MANRILLGFLVLVACHPLPAQAKQWAILIGVEKYVSTAARPLNYCVEDVQAMYTTLTEHCKYPPEQVLLLDSDKTVQTLYSGQTKLPKEQQDILAEHPDWPVTRSKVLRHQIVSWLANVEAGDQVLFYFSGHGFPHKVNELILGTHDYDEYDKGTTGISATWLLGQLKDHCKATQKLVILDCCHAGAGTRDGGKPLVNPLNALHRDAAGLVLIGSCAAEELSYEWDQKSMGMFTFYFVEGLKGRADENRDSIIDHQELFSFVQRNVKDEAHRQKSASQTPIISTKDQKGAIPLALNVTNPDPKPDRLQFVPPPPPADKPSELAENALKRLRNGSTDPAKDAETLVMEAFHLRSHSGLQNSTKNPFSIVENAQTVQEWLTVAQQHAEALSPKLQMSLKISLALAEWYRPNRDVQAAGKLATELDPFSNPAEEIKPVQLQLMIVYAGSRPQKLDSLQSYVRILDFVEDRGLKAADAAGEMLDSELLSDIVAPAYSIANALEASGASRQAPQMVARAFGQWGHLVASNPGLFEVGDSRLAESHLRNAMKLDEGNARYPLSLAHVLLTGQRRDPGALAEARTLAERAWRASGSDRFPELQRLNALRMAGDAWQLDSRLTKSMPERRAKLANAVAEYTKGVAVWPGELKALPGLQRRAHKQYVDSLLGRSAALLHQANLSDVTQIQRGQLLNQAVADADKALADTPDNPGTKRIRYLAHVARGNAYEDRASLIGETASFDVAATAFLTAKELQRYDAKPWLSEARCRFKWFAKTQDTGQLEAAKGLLTTVINELHESSATAEANYWLAKVYMAKNERSNADLAFARAWEGNTDAKSASIGMKDPNFDAHDQATCLIDWVKAKLDLALEPISKTSLSQEDQQKARKELARARNLAQNLKRLGYTTDKVMLQAKADAWESALDPDPFKRLLQSDKLLLAELGRLQEERGNLDKQQNNLLAELQRLRPGFVTWPITETNVNQKLVRARAALSTLQADASIAEAQKQSLSKPINDLILSLEQEIVIRQEQARLYLFRADLLWRTKWKGRDIEGWQIVKEDGIDKQKQPAIIGCAEEAIRLTTVPHVKAEALGLAGRARLEAAVFWLGKPNNKNFVNRVLDDADKNLKDALQLAPDHPERWQWSKALAEFQLETERIHRPGERVYVDSKLTEALRIPSLPAAERKPIQDLLGRVRAAR